MLVQTVVSSLLLVNDPFLVGEQVIIIGLFGRFIVRETLPIV